MSDLDKILQKTRTLRTAVRPPLLSLRLPMGRRRRHRSKKFEREDEMSKHYSYTVTWSSEDLEWVGLCAEFPSLSWLAKEASEALAGIEKVVAEVVNDMTASGEPLPEAIADRKYSGEFKVRIPPSQHRRLVLEAAKEGVSLNRLVSARLAA